MINLQSRALEYWVLDRTPLDASFVDRKVGAIASLFECDAAITGCLPDCGLNPAPRPSENTDRRIALRATSALSRLCRRNWLYDEVPARLCAGLFSEMANGSGGNVALTGLNHYAKQGQPTTKLDASRRAGVRLGREIRTHVR